MSRCIAQLVLMRAPRLACPAVLLWALACCSPAVAQVSLDDEFGKAPSWKTPTAADVRLQVAAWLDDGRPDDAVRRQVLSLWPNTEAATEASKQPSPAQLLERVVTTFSLIDPQSKQLADLCSQPHNAFKTPEFAWLADAKTPAFVRNNLRLWLGKWLAQQQLYDEALAQLADLQPADVVDPASLLFYQSVCQHWMLHKTEGLKTIAKLLEQKKSIPRRYAQMAELMHADLAALEDDSLDHISRRMNDVTRRLDFGHAGQRVRGVEDGIIASLDKLIKQMEDQAGGSSNSETGGSGGQGGKPRGTRSTAPAGNSAAAPGGGPGEVANKKIGNHSGWGDLPAKEREEAIQQIGKEFPSHYRDIIEQYFRKLATDEEEKQN